jgi:hypothetical protein
VIVHGIVLSGSTISDGEVDTSFLMPEQKKSLSDSFQSRIFDGAETYGPRNERPVGVRRTQPIYGRLQSLLPSWRCQAFVMGCNIAISLQEFHVADGITVLKLIRLASDGHIHVQTNLSYANASFLA